ncbi:hypothetical protein PWT90_03426 [Aphanocladium album]|nr:hypothetical protein PWT90_03426 [Aphanocladium album]
MASTNTKQDAHILQWTDKPLPHKRKATTVDEDASGTPKRHRGDTQGVEQHNAHAQSLETTMRVEAKQRLYVHPLMWSKRHLQLFGADFGAVKQARQEQRGSETKGVWNSESCLRAIGNLAGLNVRIQRLAMTDLLRSLGLRTEYVAQERDLSLELIINNPGIENLAD